MRFTPSLLFFPLMASAASVSLLRPRREGECSGGGGGPDAEAKQAVIDYVKGQLFGSGQYCPPGFDPLDKYADPWCGVCQGAYASINNNAADSAGYCMSTAEFDEAMGSFPEGENTCVAEVQELMQVLLATEDSIFEGDQCPNKC